MKTTEKEKEENGLRDYTRRLACELQEVGRVRTARAYHTVCRKLLGFAGWKNFR